MLEAEITIERSSEIVWDYFTNTKNWEKWWGGGLKSADWSEGGNLEWALGGSSPIQAITPGKMVQTIGSWMDTTFTFEPAGSDETIVRIQESSPKGGASFNDGGAAHLADLNSYLKKLKENIESETKQDTGSKGKKVEEENKSKRKYTCPYCNSELKGMALITTQVSMDSGVVDFQTNCSTCGKVLFKKDFIQSEEQKEDTDKPKDKTGRMDKNKRWKFWK